MNCPACGEQLRRVRCDTIVLQACPTCRGIWFEPNQMQEYLEIMAARPETPHASLKPCGARRVDSLDRCAETERTCPKCTFPMQKFNYSYDSNIVMDRCVACGCVWTDASEAQRAVIYFKGNPKLDKMGLSLAEHIQEQEDRKDTTEDMSSLASPLLYFGVRAVLPIGDDVPSRTIPYVTLGVIALNFVAFLAAIFSADFGGFILRMGVIPSQIMNGHNLPTLVTSMFAHSSLPHLVANMLFLWLFGNNVEDALGHTFFGLFYMISGLVSTAAFIAMNSGSTVPLVGASGAVAGVMGAYVIFYPNSSLKVIISYRVIKMPAVFYLAMWFTMQAVGWVATLGQPGGIAWVAHVAGFLFGLIAALPAQARVMTRIEQLSAAERQRALNQRSA